MRIIELPPKTKSSEYAKLLNDIHSQGFFFIKASQPLQTTAGEEIRFADTLFRLDSSTWVILEGVIGQGSFGVVYKGTKKIKIERGFIGSYAAKLEQANQPIVVKQQFFNQVEDQQSLYEDIIEETNLLRNHEIKVFSPAQDRNGIYIAMEDCGQSFDDFLQERRTLTPKERISCALSILNEINLLQQKGTVHCDLKPENICVKVVSGRLQCILIDFGMSHRQGEIVKEGLGGTPAYIAPEQAALKAREVCENFQDLYALVGILARLFGCDDTLLAFKDRVFNVTGDLLQTSKEPYDFSSLWDGINVNEFDEIFKSDLLQVLQELSNPNPHSRPSLTVVIKFFTHAMIKYHSLQPEARANESSFQQRGFHHSDLSYYESIKHYYNSHQSVQAIDDYEPVERSIEASKKILIMDKKKLLKQVTIIYQGNNDRSFFDCLRSYTSWLARQNKILIANFSSSAEYRAQRESLLDTSKQIFQMISFTLSSGHQYLASLLLSLNSGEGLSEGSLEWLSTLPITHRGFLDEFTENRASQEQVKAEFEQLKLRVIESYMTCGILAKLMNIHNDLETFLPYQAQCSWRHNSPCSFEEVLRELEDKKEYLIDIDLSISTYKNVVKNQSDPIVSVTRGFVLEQCEQCSSLLRSRFNYQKGLIVSAAKASHFISQLNQTLQNPNQIDTIKGDYKSIRASLASFQRVNSLYARDLVSLFDREYIACHAKKTLLLFDTLIKRTETLETLLDVADFEETAKNTVEELFSLINSSETNYQEIFFEKLQGELNSNYNHLSYYFEGVLTYNQLKLLMLKTFKDKASSKSTLLNIPDLISSQNFEEDSKYCLRVLFKVSLFEKTAPLLNRITLVQPSSRINLFQKAYQSIFYNYFKQLIEKQAFEKFRLVMNAFYQYAENPSTDSYFHLETVIRAKHRNDDGKQGLRLLSALRLNDSAETNQIVACQVRRTG